MLRRAALVLLAVAGWACASGESSSDGGPPRVDARPLPDSGTRPFDAGDGPDADPGDPSTPVINEFVADHSGTDTCELIEIFGAASTSYAAFSLLHVEGNPGNPGVVDRIFELGTTSSDGIWVTGALVSNTLENDTATILLVEGYTGGLEDLDIDDDGTFDDEPWTALHDAVAVIEADAIGPTTYGLPVLGDVGGASRIPDGADTDGADDWVANDVTGDGLPGGCDQGTADTGEALNTPGAPNTVQL